jgi:NitT/TauT family transport system permease protein
MHAAANGAAAAGVERLKRFSASIVRFLAACVAITIGGEIFTRVFHISRYIVPPPIDVWRSFLADHHTLLPHALVTLSEAAIGFGAGTAAALIVAPVFATSKALRKIFFPLTIAVQTVPLLVTAPVLVLIFGNGMTPKILVSALVCFFPTVVHMTKGLTMVDPALLDVFRMLRASRTQVLFKLRFPSSLPDLFSTLKLASANCVIGSILAEWISSDRGIGYLLAIYLFQLDVLRLYAAVIAGSLVAVLVLTAVEAAQTILVHWKSSSEV